MRLNMLIYLAFWISLGPRLERDDRLLDSIYDFYEFSRLGLLRRCPLNLRLLRSLVDSRFAIYTFTRHDFQTFATYHGSIHYPSITISTIYITKNKHPGSDAYVLHDIYTNSNHIASMRLEASWEQAHAYTGIRTHHRKEMYAKNVPDETYSIVYTVVILVSS